MDKRSVLVKAAVAGLMGAAIMAAPGVAGAKTKAPKDVKCYGVNKCKGFGKCSGGSHSCAGKNSCKGQAWLPMPKDSCLAIDGGSLKPKDAEPAAAPAESK
jgi:uncharacterized membrane protein